MKDSLRKLKAERDRMRKILDGEKVPPLFSNLYKKQIPTNSSLPNLYAIDLHIFNFKKIPLNPPLLKGEVLSSPLY